MTYTPTGSVQDAVVAAELVRISQAIQELVGFYIPVFYHAPEKPQRGQLVYADAASWDPGSGTGVYSFDGSAWNKIGTAAGGGATQLSELTDTGTIGYTARHVLIADGVNFDTRALVEADISDLQSYLTDAVSDGSYYGRKDGSWAEIVTGGTEFLTISEFDDADSTYYYYGGVDAAVDWKINRYHKTTYVKTSATEITNVSYSTLAAAWAVRGSLNYD